MDSEFGPDSPYLKPHYPDRSSPKATFQIHMPAKTESLAPVSHIAGNPTAENLSSHQLWHGRKVILYFMPFSIIQ